MGFETSESKQILIGVIYKEHNPVKMAPFVPELVLGERQSGLMAPMIIFKQYV
jgi:hypothetical protein